MSRSFLPLVVGRVSGDVRPPKAVRDGGVFSPHFYKYRHSIIVCVANALVVAGCAKSGAGGYTFTFIAERILRSCCQQTRKMSEREPAAFCQSSGSPVFGITLVQLTLLLGTGIWHIWHGVSGHHCVRPQGRLADREKELGSQGSWILRACYVVHPGGSSPGDQGIG